MNNQEAIDLLDNLIGMISDNQDSDYDEALKLGIKALSENKGEWIEHDVEVLRDMGYYRCSICRKGFKRFDKGIRKSDVPWIDGQPFKLHIVDNFCPNCGADMRGE